MIPCGITSAEQSGHFRRSVQREAVPGEELPDVRHVGLPAVAADQGTRHADRVAEEVVLVQRLPAAERGDGDVPGEPDSRIRSGPSMAAEWMYLSSHRRPSMPRLWSAQARKPARRWARSSWVRGVARGEEGHPGAVTA